MRRLAVLTAAAVLLTGVPDATAQRRLQVGAKVGPSFTNVSVDDGEASRQGIEFTQRIAAAGGGFVTLPLSGPVALQLEMLSAPKGTRIEDPETGTRQTLMLRYFEVPVLLRLGAAGQSTGWHVFGGGYFAIRTGATEELSVQANSSISGSREDVGDSFERFDSGWVAGAGVDIGRFLVVDGRYGQGLTNVNRVKGADDFTNRALTFMVGFRY
jgi:hypothetical protein